MTPKTGHRSRGRKSERQILIEKLRQQIEAFEDRFQALRGTPSKEDIHQLRITLRRLRASLWMASHAHPRIFFGSLQKQLRQLSQALGQVRELDVARDDALKYQTTSNRIVRERKKARQHLSIEVWPKYQRKIPHQLHQALRQTEQQAKKQFAPAIALLTSRLATLLEHRARKKKHWHQLRVIVKKARYALEAIGIDARQLHDLQDSLGRVHDLETLERLSKGSKSLHRDLLTARRNTRKKIPRAIRLTLAQLVTSPS